MPFRAQMCAKQFLYVRFVSQIEGYCMNLLCSLMTHKIKPQIALHLLTVSFVHSSTSLSTFAPTFTSSSG